MSESTSSYMSPHEGPIWWEEPEYTGRGSKIQYIITLEYPAVREALPPFTWAFEKVSGLFVPRTVLISVKRPATFYIAVYIEEAELPKGTKVCYPLRQPLPAMPLGMMAQGILGLPRLYNYENMIPIQCCIVGFWCQLGGQAPIVALQDGILFPGRGHSLSKINPAI